MPKYVTAELLIDSLQEAGVRYIFANMGSDFPGVIEALAERKRMNREAPEVIICPHESVALSAAQGFAQATGQPQAVFVHVDAGTLNLGGALSNAARTRVPVFIFAGKTPYTLEGELFGSRNRAVNHIQDVFDQAGIVRPYVKWEYDLRTGHHVQQSVYRALQIAASAPAGPVYLTGAREVLEETVERERIPCRGWDPIEPPAIPPEQIRQLASELAEAEHPLIVTSYLGRNPEAVGLLKELCERLAVPVVETSPVYMNFPATSACHWGYQAEPYVEEADLILVIDCDVPWMLSSKRPGPSCKIYYVDVDPLKEDLPMWYVPSEKFWRADSRLALRQLNECIKDLPVDSGRRDRRFRRISEIHREQREQWRREAQSGRPEITPEGLTACIREVIDDEVIVLNEAITGSMAVSKHLPRTVPGTYFGNGGASLGWSGGAAIGVKLACPDRTVVNLIGDGSYYFSVPSTVYWMAKRYDAPILTVIYNNGGWKATKQNVLRLHPDGAAKESNMFWSDFRHPSDLAGIAEAAGGAYARTVTHPEEVREALARGLQEVRNGRSAVIDVRLAFI